MLAFHAVQIPWHPCDVASHIIGLKVRYVHTLYGRRTSSFDIRNGRRLGYPKHVHILRINVLSAMR